MNPVTSRLHEYTALVALVVRWETSPLNFVFLGVGRRYQWSRGPGERRSWLLGLLSMSKLSEQPSLSATRASSNTRCEYGRRHKVAAVDLALRAGPGESRLNDKGNDGEKFHMRKSGTDV